MAMVLCKMGGGCAGWRIFGKVMGSLCNRDAQLRWKVGAADICNFNRSFFARSRVLKYLLTYHPLALLVLIISRFVSSKTVSKMLARPSVCS